MVGVGVGVAMDSQMDGTIVVLSYIALNSQVLFAITILIILPLRYLARPIRKLSYQRRDQ